MSTRPTRGDVECKIYLASEDQIIKAGYTVNIVMRHEIGHCNGWIGHAGARTWAEDIQIAQAPMPRARPAVVTAASPQHRAHFCPVTSLLTLGVLCF